MTLTIVVTFKHAIDRKPGGLNVRRYDNVIDYYANGEGISFRVQRDGLISWPINHPAELIEHVQQRWVAHEHTPADSV
jgi:hypothetical protein